MKLLFWTFVAIVAVVLALFAASNREAVALTLWPLASAIELPLYLAILLTFVAGFIVGAAAEWIGGRRWRREARWRRRRITALERELAATQARLPGAATEPTAIAARG